MREIRFRAWDDTISKFIYIVLKPGAITTFDEIVDSRTGKMHDLKQWQQFTGFHDKDGKAVWEGDIVYHKGTKSPKEHIFEVIWKDYRWKFNKKDGGHPFSQILAHPSAFKVIGNVYQNSYLLTNQNK